jgi:hypothetical protein
VKEIDPRSYLPSGEDQLIEWRFLEERLVITPVLVDGWSSNDDGEIPLLVPVTTELRERQLELIARYFHKELRYDSRPFQTGDIGARSLGFLIADPGRPMMYPFAVGGLGLHLVREKWVLMWIWLHPMYRSHGLVAKVLDQLDGDYPDLLFQAPFSKAFRSVLDGRNVAPERRVTVSQSWAATRSITPKG